MAANDARLRAERYAIEQGWSIDDILRKADPPIGASRRSLFGWSSAGEWTRRRAEFLHRIALGAAEAAEGAARAVAASGAVLSRAEGLSIAAGIARDDKLEPRDRLAAVKLAAAIEAWTGDPGGAGPLADALKQLRERRANG